MTVPKLSVPASGYGGRGYRNPFTGEIVPGVTSILNAINKDGYVNWHVENTAAYAVTHIDDLLSRTEEAGMGFLRYYTRRLKQDDLDDPSVDIYNYSAGVLDDLSELGNFIHDYIECEVNGWFPPEPWRADQEQMIEQYLLWRETNTIIPAATEATFFGDGAAGTADGVGKINGIDTLWDNKSSRKTYDGHFAQLAGLGSFHTWAREVPEGTEGAVYYKIVPSVAKHHGGQVDSWWVEDVPPPFTEYAILQVRPDDYDTKGNPVPAFAQLHRIPQNVIDAAFGLFEGALQIRRAERNLKYALKEETNE